eukprot:TRINITY_DN8635_c0_g1_i2.p1 TRINITY_DN8635_c0_g1~~TRINITY_DN8635_c0_g1_i2.p1  ORF type:complete len:153 (+),score=14.56 TRINITY_DN8635_c0_g1_i2:189-647(+)
MGVLKQLAARMILQGYLVWFACDFGKMKAKKEGFLDSKLYEHYSMYGTKPTLTKADRLHYSFCKISHIMVITGLEYDNYTNKIKHWRVENSHGEKSGQKGFYVMTEDWFDDYVFQIVVHKSFLSDDLKEIWDNAPITSGYPPYSPMSSVCFK